MDKKNKSGLNSMIFDGLGPRDKTVVFELTRPSDLVFYLYGPLEGPENYIDLVQQIRYASADQQIILHLNGPGGDMYSCMAIINAMQASEADIVTIIDGEACSSHGMIWLAGDIKMIASRHVILMLHTASTGMFGKLPEIRGSIEVSHTIIENLLDELTEDFLSETHREDIRRGVDLWFSGDDIIEIIDSKKETPETESVALVTTETEETVEE